MTATNETETPTVVEEEEAFVPIIDLGHRDTPGGRAATAAAIRRACARSGFFIVVDHGVPEDLIRRMCDVTNEFFRLPDEEKDQVAHRPGVSGFRRLGGTLARSLDRETPPDLCETFAAHVTGELEERERTRLGGEFATWTSANIWPERPTAFREVWHEYMVATSELAADLMRLFAIALDLREDFFEEKFDNHGSSVAVNYYPPQTEPPLPGQLRRGEHTDFGSLTVLFQENDRGGLQVRQGSDWKDIQAVPGSFVVNIGDLMALWTAGRWVSTLHRVVNPPTGDTSSRLSIPFFYLPNHDAVIEPIEPHDTEAAGSYRPVTVSDWVSAKVQKIFSGST